MKARIIKAIFATIAFCSPIVPLAAQTSGIVLTRQWGEFGDKPGQFKYPAMIAADKSSNIYVVDQHNHRIQKFDPEGNFILLFGRQGSGTGEFNYPYGIAIDSKENIYVTDMNNNRVEKFSPEGEFIASTGSYGSEKGQFKYPYGIAIDDNDVLYVIDAFNYRIQKFSSDLKYLAEWGDQESIGIKLYLPHEIAISANGNIILSDRQNHRISFFTSDGKLLKRIGEFGEGINSGGMQFSEPHGISVNKSGDIFICDRYNFRIHRFSSEGEFLNQWNTADVFDNSRYFPIGVVAAENGSIYITDNYAHCVQKYNTRIVSGL